MPRPKKRTARLNVEVTPEYLKELKLLAIHLDKVSVKEMVLEALNDYKAQHRKAAPRREIAA
jgi:hypothetical protein